MRRLAIASLAATASIIALAIVVWPQKLARIVPAAAALKEKPPAFTVEQRLDQFGQGVAARLASSFAAAEVDYPPHQVAYVAFKDERSLHVYARNSEKERWRYIKQYQVLAASGQPGPKLIEGDRQVPEGIYKAEFLNANSRFHLSIRLDYPNDFDRRMALRDNRSRLGGDIMIHGNRVSIGCLAMGDQAAEDLFILAAQVSRERIRIVVSPTDFRIRTTAPSPQSPAWTGELYDSLRKELGQYPKPA